MAPEIQQQQLEVVLQQPQRLEVETEREWVRQESVAAQSAVFGADR